jgi:hypothetical protein
MFSIKEFIIAVFCCVDDLLQVEPVIGQLAGRFTIERV